jgi:hypothetical protein
MGKDGRPEYEVEFRERRLEEIADRLNRFKRKDEAAFDAVARVSEFGQKAYELLMRPAVQAVANEASAKVSRELHPLRTERWAFSDLNPWLAWLGPAADAVLDGKTLPRQSEKMVSGMISAGLDYYRAVRDATSEALFFQTYGSMFALTADGALRDAGAPTAEAGEAAVSRALAAIDQGGFGAALARIGALLSRHGEPLPLERLALRAELRADHSGLAPEIEQPNWNAVRGEQELVVRYATEEAIETLPRLLARAEDRRRLMQVVDHLLADPRIRDFEPTPEQKAMLARLRTVLKVPARAASGPAGRSAKRRRAR